MNEKSEKLMIFDFFKVKNIAILLLFLPSLFCMGQNNNKGVIEIFMESGQNYDSLVKTITADTIIKIVVHPMSQPPMSDKEFLMKDILQNGSIESYRSFKTRFVQIEIFYYTLIMAYKYDYLQAYEDLCHFLNCDLCYNTNCKTKLISKMFVDNLLIADEKGSKYSKQILEKYHYNGERSYENDEKYFETVWDCYWRRPSKAK